MTKIRHILIIVICLFSAGLQAQISIGARAGFGFSSTSLELTKGISRAFGYSPQFGLMLHYNLDLKFSVGLEVNYAKFAETITYAPGYIPNQLNELVSKTEISYVQIPVTARASIGEKKIRAFVNVGPYLGFGINGLWDKGPRTLLLSNVNNPTPKGVIFDTAYSINQGKMKKIDLGGVVAAGAEYKLGETGLLFLELRGQLGFLDIYNLTDLEARSFVAQSSTNYLVPSGSWRAFCISLGYIRTFKLPKFTANPDAKRAGKQKTSK